MRIFGKILNASYTQLLREHDDIDLNSIILLDYVQKKIKISKEAHQLLKNRKLVEGRYPNIHLSSEVHEYLEDKAGYIKKRGFEKIYYEKLVIEYLKKFGNASRQDINDLLLRQLPDVLGQQQKVNKIHNLLHEMSRKKNLIKNSASSTKRPVWVLAK